MTPTEPLICSQGGIPYNKPHLDAKDAEIERLRSMHQGMCRVAGEQSDEIERLRAVPVRAYAVPPVTLEMLDEAADIISKHLAHQLSTQESWMFLRQARDKLREARALLSPQSTSEPTNAMAPDYKAEWEAAGTAAITRQREIERLCGVMTDAADAIERGSSTAPVAECLRAAAQRAPRSRTPSVTSGELPQPQGRAVADEAKQD